MTGINKEELLAKAKKPADDAMKLHPFYKGKVEVTLKCCVRDLSDFAIWYTPGVAAPCRDIFENKEKVYEHTNKGNFVAVISNGTRVLGLGNIGPEASMPVMEGKALLFKYLGGVDAFPICLDITDPDEFINTVKALQPTFGGVNLEDIENPQCFYILDRLREECEIPIWHDDQQGTAVVNLAGLINALKIVNKKMGEAKITVVGAGSANIATMRLLIAAGVEPGNIIAVDSKGILHKGRTEFEGVHAEKWKICQTTNSEQRKGGIAEALVGADACIALSTPGPDTLKKEWIEKMNDDAIVFACANPIPEIWPWEAKDAGARIISTGRSDFPNQVNNSLCFPSIFRGVLDVQGKTITDTMCIAAAEALANFAAEQGLNEEKILPGMDEWEVFPRVAVATALQAMKEGVARVTLTEEELYRRANHSINRSQDTTKLLMEKEIIPKAPF